MKVFFPPNALPGVPKRPNPGLSAESDADYVFGTAQADFQKRVLRASAIAAKLQRFGNRQGLAVYRRLFSDEQTKNLGVLREPVVDGDSLEKKVKELPPSLPVGHQHLLAWIRRSTWLGLRISSRSPRCSFAQPRIWSRRR